MNETEPCGQALLGEPEPAADHDMPSTLLETSLPRTADADRPARSARELNIAALLNGSASHRPGEGGTPAGLMASWHPVGRALHLRRWHRVPVQVSILVAGWDDAAAVATAPMWSAIMRDVSPGGLSFTHSAPITSRRVSIYLDGDGAETSGWLLRLTWCRYTRCGVYQSGGAIVRPLEAQIGDH